MKKELLLSGLMLAGGISGQTQSLAKKSKLPERPNIIYILADDLGYGDLSCYGQKKFSTPNIDKLAAEGIRFTSHYAGCAVSAPSRSCLLTGLHTGHTPIRGNKSVKPEGQWPLPAQTVTFPKLLQQAGYKTGAFGKWGLGYVGTEGDPNKQGFDEFFGFNCQTLAHNYYPDHLWHNQEKIILKENADHKRGVYAPLLIHNKAIEFIDQNKNNRFFMFYCTTIPHAELTAPDDYMARFRNKFLPEKSFKGVDSGPTYRLGPYGSQPEVHAAFAAMVNVLDDKVGEIVAELKKLGLDKNTLIIFSSDNGPHVEGGADPDYFDSNGPFRGYKRDLYEGGIREPMIAVWPGKIKPGRMTDHISAFWDVMPTVADIAGVKSPAGIDGISFLPTLLGGKQPQHEYLYWEFYENGGRIAMRMGNWKAVQYSITAVPKPATELYDLSKDPGEKNNIAASHPDIVKKMEGLMKSSHTPSDVFTFSAKAINE
ncbi:MAG: arylsulfatase [Bacteroidota bacterium]|nr:arylsulfatase [Bacteroidota bacterium]